MSIKPVDKLITNEKSPSFTTFACYTFHSVLKHTVPGEEGKVLCDVTKKKIADTNNLIELIVKGLSTFL